MQGLNVEAAERQLDRVQTFFPRIDGKASALFAITSGQIAIAALNLSADDWKHWWIAVPGAVFMLCSAWVVTQLYRCAYPHLEGGQRSLIYFKEIADMRESEFISEFTQLSDEGFRNDVVAQIWRNSEIAACKFRYLKQATAAAMLSLIPWSLLLISTSLTHWRMPVIP